MAVPVSGAKPALLDVYRPKTEPANLPTILWVHGGGYLSGDKAQVAKYAIKLASDGFVVASLQYSLAPDTKYPVPVAQADAALTYLRNHAVAYGGNPDIEFVGGDSAGAQITSQVAAIRTNPALAQDMHFPAPSAVRHLAGVVLDCGLYDMNTVGASGFPALRTLLWSYTGVRDWKRFGAIDQLSTTRQITKNYPATYLTVGNADPFRGQSDELTRALNGEHVPHTTRFWAHHSTRLNHEYQFDFTTPEANANYAATLQFLQTHAQEQP
ncbi:hypothetical protein GCM10022256_16080 [Frondihabitans peucedani]|uniref:BD-FAE-like domain-containing protein n=1 Tax=Frondihabitans peucedani TaxID=598626 RepID=A0ABP8E1B6_9MICO